MRDALGRGALARQLELSVADAWASERGRRSHILPLALHIIPCPTVINENGVMLNEIMNRPPWSTDARARVEVEGRHGGGGALGARAQVRLDGTQAAAPGLHPTAGAK